MTKYFILATVFWGLISCGRQGEKFQNIKVNDHYNATLTAIQIKDKLELAYKQMQSDSFKQIFITWNESISPNAEEFIHQNDTINALFAAYKEFYKPLDLLKLGKWEWGNNLNSKCEYVAIQNKIFYSVMDTDNFSDFDWEKSRKDSIINFRPPLNLDKNKVLYLTDEYAKSINQFLGTESTEPGEGNIMNPSIPIGESEKRYKIIRSYIPILEGHWGKYWHLATHPDIAIILFDKTLKTAKIDFRVGYEGGTAILKKIDKDWEIVDSRATWIE